MHTHPNSNITSELSAYIAGIADAELPPEVIKKAKHHILDSIAAIVSGSNLQPGQLAKKYVQKVGGVPEATVAGSNIITSVATAAFANGMMAHADETDDSHTKTLVHPGSSVIPAALAMGEKAGVDGLTFLKSVIVGYDIGCGISQALDPKKMLHGSGATPGIGGIFGAAAASAAVAGLGVEQVMHVLSYAAQQASGVNFWMRDQSHVQKAFVFGGMPAQHGVASVLMVQSGFTGVLDCFRGEHNFFNAFSSHPKPESLVESLGRRFEIMFTDMKKYSVGFPIQAPLDALLALKQEHHLSASDVEKIRVFLPQPGVKTVNNREMPDVNLQFILSVTMLDGELTFKSAHSFERMNDPAVIEMKKKISLDEAVELTASKLTRHGIVEVFTKDGIRLQAHGLSRGTVENPMTPEEVEEKCRDLLLSILGNDRTQMLIEKVRDIEKLKNIKELASLLVCT